MSFYFYFYLVGTFVSAIILSMSYLLIKLNHHAYICDRSFDLNWEINNIACTMNDAAKTSCQDYTGGVCNKEVIFKYTVKNTGISCHSIDNVLSKVGNMSKIGVPLDMIKSCGDRNICPDIEWVITDKRYIDFCSTTDSQVPIKVFLESDDKTYEESSQYNFEPNKKMMTSPDFVSGQNSQDITESDFIKVDIKCTIQSGAESVPCENYTVQGLTCNRDLVYTYTATNLSDEPIRIQSIVDQQDRQDDLSLSEGPVLVKPDVTVPKLRAKVVAEKTISTNLCVNEKVIQTNARIFAVSFDGTRVGDASASYEFTTL